MMGVVDASIGWLVQTILASLFTEPIEAWARGVGLDEDVENLKSEMRDVQMVLAAAEGRRIENKPLVRSLHDLKELLYDAEDVMDELDYYCLQQQIEQGTSLRSSMSCTSLPCFLPYFCLLQIVMPTSSSVYPATEFISWLVVVSFRSSKDANV
jgi:hypothetical protein